MHPTVSEYLEDNGWEDGVDEALRREAPGATDLARIFGAYPSTWGTSGSSWGPQIPAATHRLGIPSNIYAHVSLDRVGAWWFAGQLCYPNGVGLRSGEDACCDDARFEKQLPELLQEIESLARAGTSCVLLFGGHPTRFMYTQFWDAINYSKGRNPDPEDYRSAPRREACDYATGIRNLRRMVRAVRDLPGVEMTSVRALNGQFLPECGPVSWQELSELAEARQMAGKSASSTERRPRPRPWIYSAERTCGWQAARPLPTSCSRVQCSARSLPVPRSIGPLLCLWHRRSASVERSSITRTKPATSHPTSTWMGSPWAQDPCSSGSHDPTAGCAEAATSPTSS